MMRVLCFFVVALGLIWPGLSSAQAVVEKILPMDGHVAPNNSAIELNWFDAQPSRVGGVTVKRRALGQSGGSTWKVISPQLGPVMRFTDTDIVPGTAYEYQVLRSARDIVDVGYWIAGGELPAQEFRGTAHLVIDETIAQDIAPRLARFERDLVGDGWTIRRYASPRHTHKKLLKNLNAAAALKAQLREQYFADPFGHHAVILIGHVPVVMSGRANPDGHEPKPHGTDLFYAEMDAKWRVNQEGLLLHNTVPSDAIEMQVGRIDFASVALDDRDQEIQWLRAYFDKNHHWRMQFHGDLRNAYAKSNNLVVEHAALRNIVGAGAVTAGGHHTAGEERPWLWGVDFGDYNGSRYAEKYQNKAVFALNFGSGKQRFAGRYSPLNALLAQPWYTIATGWGARPAWWLHLMALGDSIGEVHRRTVNNGVASEPYRESMDYYPPGLYMFRNPVWVNLMGDPTARAFPMAPPRQVRLETAETGTTLSWEASPDPDATGYKVYRAPMGSMQFAPLTKEPVDALSFTDPDPLKGARYMVRAYGLKKVYAGSFFQFSQGAFSSETPLSEPLFDREMSLSAPGQQPVVLPDLFDASGADLTYAFIEGPKIGKLAHDGTHWVYQPVTGFIGAVPLRFSVSTAMQTEQGVLTLNITAPLRPEPDPEAETKDP